MLFENLIHIIDFIFLFQLLRSVTFHESIMLCSMRKVTTDHQGATWSSSKGTWNMCSGTPEAKPFNLFCMVLVDPVKVAPPCLQLPLTHVQSACLN